MTKFLQSPIVLAGLVIFTGFLLLQIIKINPEKIDLNKKVANLERQINETEAAIKDLENKAEYYQSDIYKERQARLKLNYKKPGETVIFIYDNPGNVETQQTESNDGEKLGWRRLLQYLFRTD